MQKLAFVMVGLLGLFGMPGRDMGYEFVTIPLENSIFITEYDESLKNRTINLEIAAETVNNTILLPGEVFSFNEIIGKPTRAKGYRSAKVFIKGREVSGIGGGICQLSSALYNAADLAGLEIIERHAHSKEVFYVPEGRDAATAYGGIDFKFRNTFEYPIQIVAEAANGMLIVMLEAILEL